MSFLQKMHGKGQEASKARHNKSVTKKDDLYWLPRLLSERSLCQQSIPSTSQVCCFIPGCSFSMLSKLLIKPRSSILTTLFILGAHT